MLTRTTTIAVGAFTLLLTGAPLAEAAVENPSWTVTGPSQETGLLSLSQTEALGIAAYAESSGESIEAVTEYVRGQDAFGQAAGEIEAAFGRTFVTALWDGPGSPKTAVYVRPSVRDAVASLFPGVPVVASELLTSDERGVVEGLLMDSAETVPGIDVANAYVDPLTNAGTIAISTASSGVATPPPDPAGAVTAAVQSLARAEGVAPLTVTETPSALGVPEQYSGGNWNNRCTAGFTAVRAGKPAMTSTAHCASVRSYQGASLSRRVNTSVAGGHVSSYIALGGKLTNSARVGWSSYVAIRRVWDPVVGSVVCHFGISSAYSCAKLIRTNQVVNFSGIGRVGKIDVVNKSISKPGDSGGPWYWGNIAHGLHMGSCTSLGGSCFSQITSLNALGTAIYKG